jgi:hypothetical protein
MPTICSLSTKNATATAFKARTTIQKRRSNDCNSGENIAFTKNDVRWPGKRNEKVVVNIQ